MPTISIPQWHPTPINRLLRMHPFKRGRVLKAEYEVVWAYVQQAQIPRATTRRRVAVTFVLQPGQRACDPDAQQKGLLDGLKNCGAIRNDNRTWIELQTPQYRRGTAREWGTEIELEDLD